MALEHLRSHSQKLLTFYSQNHQTKCHICLHTSPNLPQIWERFGACPTWAQAQHTEADSQSFSRFLSLSHARHSGRRRSSHDGVDRRWPSPRPPATSTAAPNNSTSKLSEAGCGRSRGKGSRHPVPASSCRASSPAPVAWGGGRPGLLRHHAEQEPLPTSSSMISPARGATWKTSLPPACLVAGDVE